MLESSQCIVVKAAWVRFSAQKRLEASIGGMQRGSEGQAKEQKQGARVKNAVTTAYN